MAGGAFLCAKKAGDMRSDQRPEASQMRLRRSRYGRSAVAPHLCKNARGDMRRQFTAPDKTDVVFH
jgi:hypothetical protein